MGFPGQDYWSELPLPPPGDLPDVGIEPEASASPALAGGFFTTEPPGKPMTFRRRGQRIQCTGSRGTCCGDIDVTENSGNRDGEREGEPGAKSTQEGGGGQGVAMTPQGGSGLCPESRGEV